MEADFRVTPLAAAAVAVALGALGYGATKSVDWLRASDAYGRTGAADQQLLSCLESRLHQLVPSGTRVAIGSNSSLFQQRLVEWSVPSLTLVKDERDASAVLLVRHVNGGCHGYDVVVQRPAP